MLRVLRIESVDATADLAEHLAGELVRVHRSADGTVDVGSGPGRGAWLCAPPQGLECFDEARVSDSVPLMQMHAVLNVGFGEGERARSPRTVQPDTQMFHCCN